MVQAAEEGNDLDDQARGAQGAGTEVHSDLPHDAKDLFARLLRDGLVKRHADDAGEGGDATGGEEGEPMEDEGGRASPVLVTPRKEAPAAESGEGVSSPLEPVTGSAAAPEGSSGSAAYKRSNMLVDIVKGIVGPAEWLEGKTANVQRLCGMESYSALLIISASYIHILRYALK